jgi:hypothetical protein
MVFAAGTFAGNVLNLFLFLAVCLGIISWRLKKIDPEGKIKTAARDGLASMIGRWLK